MKKLLVFLFVTVNMGCSDSEKMIDASFPVIEKNKSIVEVRQLIIGTWEWSKSINQSSPEIIVSTPSSAGYTRTLAFLNNDSLKVYENDTLTNSSTFQIDSVSGHFTLNSNIFFAPDIRINSEAFTYDERPVDGDLVYYVKK